jgi:hypothetical protein
LLLVVAVRAAASFSSERERRTLDDLLTTPLDNGTILIAKWLGSILSVRKGCWALLAIWGLGMLVGNIRPFAFPVLVIAWIVYAVVIAGIGVWCSLACRTTLRATIWTLGITAGLVVLPWAVELIWDVLAYVFSLRQNAWGDLPEIALSPPITLSWLASIPREGGYTRMAPPIQWEEEYAAGLFGLILYAAAGRGLWWIIRARFGRLTGRMPV